MTLFTLGTFHERQGDQELLDDPQSPDVDPSVFEGDPPPAFWGRLYGEKLAETWSGPLTPHFDGQMGAIQAGTDLAHFQLRPGDNDHVGVLLRLYDGRRRSRRQCIRADSVF